ncbi:MAG: hypothetical protein J3Q66DRAFT_334270 [Benniella sp.]|nr:MAG: hypothetical protein J3Q66DRAFT_334270 [Benniella sp.]
MQMGSFVSRDQVASASCDKTMRLWNSSTGSCCHILSGMEDIANCVVYSPGEDQIAIGGDDCTAENHCIFYLR